MTKNARWECEKKNVNDNNKDRDNKEEEHIVQALKS